MRKHTILFLAASPGNMDLRALDREAHSIRLELRRSGGRDRFEFHTRWAAEPLDLLRELRELKPVVVHFCGHGDQAGLHFHTAKGHRQVASPEAIAEAFGAAGPSVRVVILNASYTETIAEALLAHVECVVGMGGGFHDDAARSFAIGFYGGLGEHESIAAAYQQGNAAIRLEGVAEAERPQLKVRNGFDATQLILASTAPVVRLALPCPYPGMRPYSADDAGSFRGRNTEIEELFGRLRANEREIYVIGPSGSGKSSLIMAGILPRLARGIAGLGPFIVRSMRPGEHPSAQLRELLEIPQEQLSLPANPVATLLAHRGPSSSVLIVIDQLEELFTLARGDEREYFLAALRTLRIELRCVVLLALRADFFGAFMESGLWTDRPGQISRIEVASLRGEALREAIAYPARDLGVIVEPELIERLLADAASEPGILPLLQETMVQLWDGRTDQTLRLVDYQALGDTVRSGIAVALSRRADTVLRALTREQEGIARRILLRLVSFGEGRSDTRRQQRRSMLRSVSDDVADFEHVLQQMITAHLLTADESEIDAEARIDLAHEVMIAAWPKLAAWIQAHRADEQRRRHVEAAAALWIEHGRGARGLLDPIELAEAEAWHGAESARELGQSADVTGLIAASKTSHARRRRSRRMLIAVAFAIVMLFAVIALRQASENRHLLAQSYQEAGRQLFLDGHPYEAIPYLLAAREKGEGGVPLRMLFWKTSRFLPLVGFAHHGAVVSAAFSLDGTRVVTAGYDNTARVWDAASGNPLTRPLEHQGWVAGAAFSPDGSRVVTASYDNTARIWDVATGNPLARFLGHHGAVLSAMFSPDGTRVATVSDDNTAQIWNARTGKIVVPPLEHHGAVRSVAFSSDGMRVVTASYDKTARVWAVATGKPLTDPLEHHEVVVGAAFSPDGNRVVTASYDRTARVWNADTGKPLTGPLEHQGAVLSAAFSPDGARVVTASYDMTARVWNADTGKPLTEPLEHQGAVLSAAFSPDGARIVTASGDQTAQVWDAAASKPLTLPFEHQGLVLSAAFSPDGNRVITVSVGNVASIWDAAPGKALTSPLAHREAVVSAAFNAAGTRVVTASADKTARVWDAATGTPVAGPLEHQGSVMNAAFSPDGTRVVTASFDKTARVWDAATGKHLVGPLTHHGELRSAAFSPDGSRIVTASADRTARVWDAATGKPLTGPLEHRGWVLGAAFSPDGTRIVTASADRTACVWDAATGIPLISLLDHQGEVLSAAFSPDGTRIVTSSADRTARVWNAATGRPITNPLEHQGSVSIVVFSPDGTRVVTASLDGTARVWDAATGKPVTSPLEHHGEVSRAAFSPDGTRVVTASLDGAARVWDAATGKLLASPFVHQGPVRSAVFSRDGIRMLTSSDDRTARIWDVGLDNSTLGAWSAMAKRGPFVLSGSVHMRRAERMQVYRDP